MRHGQYGQDTRGKETLSTTCTLQAGFVGDRLKRYVTARGLELETLTLSSQPRATYTALIIERHLGNVALVRSPLLSEGEIPHFDTTTGGVSGRDVS